MLGCLPTRRPGVEGPHRGGIALPLWQLRPAEVDPGGAMAVGLSPGETPINFFGGNSSEICTYEFIYIYIHNIYIYMYIHNIYIYIYTHYIYIYIIQEVMNML